MKSLYLRISIIFLGILVTGCSSVDSKKYLVSIYKLENAVESSKAYVKATSAILKKNDGAYLKTPIIIEKNLPNTAQPSFTQKAIGDVIFIAEFKNRDSLEAFIKNADVVKQMDVLKSAATEETVFIGKDFNPMGMMSDTVPLKEFESRDKPAFLMINDISMNSFLNPMTPYRIMKYMDANFPMLEKAKVRFIRPLEKVENLRGKYSFDVLNLSEWPSEEVFNDFHIKPIFIKLAQDTRNKAFNRFTESKAQPLLINDL